MLLRVLLRPWANTNLRNKLYELSQTRTSAGLREKIFNSNFPGAGGLR